MSHDELNQGRGKEYGNKALGVTFVLFLLAVVFGLAFIGLDSLIRPFLGGQ